MSKNARRAFFIALVVLWAALVIRALVLGTMIAHAADRATLDRCEAKLTACYETCKAEKPASLCNVQCSTVLCGLTWRMSFGGFQDLRIEETAGTGLPGLTIKEKRHVSATR